MMRHRSYKCTKCPETMTSKCPATRSTFPTHTYVTMVANDIVKRTKPYNACTEDVCLTLEYGRGHPGASAEDMFAEMIRVIRAMTDDEALILSCNHEWELRKEEACTD